MAVPDFQSLMLPILQELANSGQTKIAVARTRVASACKLTESDLQQMLPSRRQPVFVNRVSWAIIHMERAGLVERIQRGVYQITKRGTELLLIEKPVRVDMDLLRRYPEYVDWQQRSQTSSAEQTSTGVGSAPSDQTPEEALDLAARQLQTALEADVLNRVRAASSAFLERVVVRLLSQMGYGGGDVTLGQVTGGPGDGGIDGWVLEDPLGLNRIAVQAKRFSDGSNVSGRDLRDFAGALDAAGWDKGVFVTTARFTDQAQAIADRSTKRIILIDGEKLAQLMVQYDVGVQLRAARMPQIKTIDDSYFDEEDL